MKAARARRARRDWRARCWRRDARARAEAPAARHDFPARRAGGTARHAIEDADCSAACLISGQRAADLMLSTKYNTYHYPAVLASSRDFPATIARPVAHTERPRAFCTSALDGFSTPADRFRLGHFFCGLLMLLHFRHAIFTRAPHDDIASPFRFTIHTASPSHAKRGDAATGRSARRRARARR